MGIRQILFHKNALWTCDVTRCGPSKMYIILEQCPGTIGIAVDVVVYGPNESEHDANLHRLMQVAVKEGLVFNSKKMRNSY